MRKPTYRKFKTKREEIRPKIKSSSRCPDHHLTCLVLINNRSDPYHTWISLNVHHVHYIHIERDRSEYLEGNLKWLINCSNNKENGVNITRVLKINKPKSWIFFCFFFAVDRIKESEEWVMTEELTLFNQCLKLLDHVFSYDIHNLLTGNCQ